MPTEIKTIRNGRWLYRLEFRDARFTGNVKREPFDPDALSDAAIEINGINYLQRRDFSDLFSQERPLVPRNNKSDIPPKKERKRSYPLTAAALVIAFYALIMGWSLTGYHSGLLGKALNEASISAPNLLMPVKYGQAHAAVPAKPADVAAPSTGPAAQFNDFFQGGVPVSSTAPPAAAPAPGTPSPQQHGSSSQVSVSPAAGAGRIPPGNANGLQKH